LDRQSDQNLLQEKDPVSHDRTESPHKGYQTGGWKAHWIVIVATILYTICYMDSTVIGIVLQPMKVDLGLSDAEAGWLLSIFPLGIVVMSYPVSYLIDRWSRKKMIALMVIFWSIFTATTGLAKNFAGALVSRLLVGAGQSGYSTGGIVMITAAYPLEKHSRMLGIFNAGLPLGQIAGMVVGGLLSANYGWRTPFFIFAPIGIVFGLLALLLKDYKTVKQKGNVPGNEFLRSIVYLLKISTLRWYYLGMGFMTLMSLTSSWGAALIMRQTGCKEDVAGYVLGALVAITIIAAVLGGRVGDIWVKKSPRSRLILPAIVCVANPLITAAAVLALMSSAQGSGLATIGFILYFIGSTATAVLYMVALPALTAANQEVVTPDRKGTAWGFAILSMFLIGGWAPLAIGGISDALGGDAWGLASGIMIVGMSGLVAAFCYYMSSRYFVQDSEKVKDMVIEG